MAARRAGWDVHYVETIGWNPRPPKPRQINGINVTRMWNILPFAGKAFFEPSRWTNRYASGRRFLHNLLDTSDLVLIYDPLFSVKKKSWHAKMLYDCVDAYEAQPQYSGPVSRLLLQHFETRLARQCKSATSTSSTLTAHKKAKWGDVKIATLVGAFEPWEEQDDRLATVVRTKKVRAKKAILVSALDRYKLDLKFLSDLANANKEWQFVVYGKSIWGSSAEVQNYLNFSNVTYEGVKSFDQIIASQSDAAVGLIALSDSEYSRYSFPLKLWDYLASGLPVLAYNAPSVPVMPGVVHASNSDLDLDLVVNQDCDPSALVSTAYRNTSDDRWKAVSSQ